MTAGEAKPPLAGLDDVRLAQATPKLPPVHLWNPEREIDIGMRIARDGSWHHDGALIRREALVRLFSTILRREADGRFFLVTPVEKCLVDVEDAPFLAVLLSSQGLGRDQRLEVRTTLGDTAIIDGDHGLRFETEPGSCGLKPYVTVRGRLEALFNRQLVHDLGQLVSVGIHNGKDWYGVWSSGQFWPVEPVTDKSEPVTDNGGQAQ